MSLPSLAFAAATAAVLALETASGTLQGTELVPEGAGPFPVVLLIAGSGPTDRDGNTRLIPGRNDSLKLLAEGLAREGVASVRYDKRGVAGSAQAARPESELRFEHLVDDAAGWVAKLRADRRFSRVVVAGHSEGSLVGMLAARNAKADGFASIAGLARPADAALREQLKGKLPPPLAAENDRILEALKAGRMVPDADPQLAALYRPSVQPYLVSWMKHDPAEAFARLGMPALVVQGTHDVQVPVEEARRLAAANPAARLVLVEGMNHVLKQAPPGLAAQQASYGDPSLPVDPAVIGAVAALARGKP